MAEYDAAFGDEVAKWVTKGFAGEDREDLKQVARLAVWENAGKPRNLVWNIAHRRVIDEWRRLKGRREPSRVAKLKIEFDPAFMDSAVDDEVPDPVWENGFAVGGRDEFIARGLALGMRKWEVAEQLGIHPSRVSQLLTEMRRRAA